MNALGKRLDRVEQTLSPPAPPEHRYVWVDSHEDAEAKVAALLATGYTGQVTTIGWRRAFNAEHGGDNEQRA